MATLTRHPTFVNIQPKRTRSLAFHKTHCASPHDATTTTYIKPDPPSPPRQRPVLIPIHPSNPRTIRRMPPTKAPNRLPSTNTSASSRTTSVSYDLAVIDSSTIIGRKRKRVPSGGNGGNENMDSSVGAGLVRSGSKSGGLKRTKSAHATLSQARSAMDLDGLSGEEAPPARTAAKRFSVEHTIDEEVDEEGEQLDSSDDFYISSALPWQLQKLLKDELLRLYHRAGLENDGEDDELLTKVDIVNAIIQARKRPRSSGQSSSPSISSRRRTATGSTRSPCSSQEGGNDAGAENSDDELSEENRNDRKRARFTRPDFVALDNQLGLSTARRARFASNVIPSQVQTQTRSTRGSGQRVSPSSPSGPSSGGINDKPTTSSPRHVRPTRKGKAKHVEFSEDDETVSTEDDEVRAIPQEDDRTPTRNQAHRRTQSTSALGPSLKQASSIGARAGLTRPESKVRVFSPKRLRRLPSRTNILNGVDKAGPSRPSLPTMNENHAQVARSISFATARQSLPRRAKPGGSLKEDSSSEDRDVDESDGAAAPPSRDVSAEEEEDQLAGDSDSNDGSGEEVFEDAEDDADVFTAPRRKPKSQPPRGAKATAVVESDDSELTDLSAEEDLEETQVVDDEDEDVEPTQVEDVDETPKPGRTKVRDRTQATVKPMRTLTRSRSRMDPVKVSGPARSAGRKAIEPELDTDEGEEEEDAEAVGEDGEQADGEGDSVEECDDAEEAEEVAEDDDDAASEKTASDEEPAEMEIEPRVLRNGKVVGEVSEAEDEAEEDEIDEEDEEVDAEGQGEEDEEVPEAEDDEEDAEAEVMDEDAEGNEEDDDMDEDFDLADATAKTLVRLRRDDLVRLCETRDLEAEGTKNQLVESLLQWRNQLSTMPSSSAQPSSYASTARAPDTSRPNNANSPVLMRPNRVHVLQPRTPDPDPGGHEIVLIGSKGRNDNKDHGDELELDLESLGLEDREIPADKLTKLEKIGSGGFKDVYIGKFRGRKVAIAEFRGHLGPMDIKELKLLRDFNHPNVVRFLGVSIPENTRETPVMMISELCANGDLFDYVRNVPPPSLRKVLNLMLDIARGINYLHNVHQPSIIHRDCKSSNILITSKVTAKIADFGLAKVKQSTRSMVKSLVGTVNWQAPELWHAHPKYDYKVDVFSCAMVFWEMLQWHSPSKKYPWEGMNEHAIYEEVGAKNRRPSVTGLRRLWCPEIVELVEAMWAQDPKERPPISDVVDELETIIKNL
ncbi:hypothetical protein FRB94_011800 [Tulasnella sp. JGI-2019a]|nr:hypothetical protein FRB94_011800 [Tulasnella sp. JGI-2019a]